MKREFLKRLGIDPETMQQILDQHGQSIEVLHDQIAEHKETIKAQKAEIKELTETNQQIADDEAGESAKLKATISEMEKAHKTALEEAQKAAADEKAAHEATVKTHGEAETKRNKREAVLRQLKADGANEKFLNTVALAVNMDDVELDGDTIKNWDKVSASVKVEHANVFTTAEVVGTKPATPPKDTTGSTATLTREQVKNMTPADINKNWEAVQAALKD